MTKKELLILKQKEVELALKVDNMGRANTPIDAEEAIRQQVQYQITRDLLFEARSAYRNAFDKWYAAGCPE